MPISETSLAPLLRLLPDGWSLTRLGDHRPAGEEGWGLSQDGQPRLDLVLKSESQAVTPRRVGVLAMLGDLRRERRAPDRSVVPVVVAPYVSPTARELLDAARVGYIDETGNVRICASEPLVSILARGADRNPRPPAGGQQSLKGAAAAATIRALLDFRPPYTLAGIAEAAGVSAATVTRTMRLLLHEGLVERHDTEYQNLDWPNVLRRWAADYERPVRREERYIPTLGIERFIRDLALYQGTYALTGRAAVHPLAREAALDEVCVYAETPDELVARYKLAPVDPLARAGLTVRLVQPAESYVLARAAVDPPSASSRGDLRCVAYSQLVVDLLTGPGREPSEGEALLSRMRSHDEWRRDL